MNKSLEKAFDHYQTADHLFHTTFLVAKDPKLLLAIVKSLSNALEYALEAILTKEKIPAPEGLLDKINTLRPVAAKHSISAADLLFMLKIHEILYLQKDSPMEFRRGKNHVICSDDYALEVLSEKEIEAFLKQSKKILNLLNKG